MYTLETLLLLRRCINFEDYALILFVFDLQLCIVVDCVIRIGVRPAISNDRFSVRIFRFCRLREYWVNVTFVSK